MIQHALDWLNMGVSPIPVYYRSKHPVVHWRPYQQQLPTETDITKWFRYKWRNLAIVTGWQGLTVLDFDSFSIYTEWYETMGHSVAQYTRCAATARGIHLYLILPTAPRCFKVSGIDVRGIGGYVLAPPSVHPSGAAYQWLNDGPILKVDSLEGLLPHTYTEQPTVKPSSPWDNANRLTCGGSVSEIKQRVSILDFFPGAEKSGDHWYKTLCPFHKDRKPSMWIDTRHGLCGCYSCGFKPMDVINVYARLHQVDNRAAISELMGYVND